MLLSNGLISVRINRQGEMTDCRDARGHRRIGGKANVLKLFKDVPRLYDAWDIDSMYDQSPVALEENGALELMESTPGRAAVKVTRRVGHSDWTQVIALTAGSTRIDFDTRVDWHEQHRLLKAAFPTGIHAEEGINEIQFGYIKRPTHRSRPYDADRFEVCNHRYTALCDESHGAAVLNDSKYGVSMLGDEIALTLLRAAACPDPHADQGEHHFVYSYYLWDGPFADCVVVREGCELNVPVTAVNGAAETFSLMRVDAPNVIIDTVKAAEDGSGDVIVRLYESKHAQTAAKLTLGFPAAQAFACDMLENPQQELAVNTNAVTLAMRAFEIKTVRIKRK